MSRVPVVAARVARQFLALSSHIPWDAVGIDRSNVYRAQNALLRVVKDLLREHLLHPTGQFHSFDAYDKSEITDTTTGRAIPHSRAPTTLSVSAHVILPLKDLASSLSGELRPLQAKVMNITDFAWEDFLSSAPVRAFIFSCVSKASSQLASASTRVDLDLPPFAHDEIQQHLECPPGFDVQYRVGDAAISYVDHHPQMSVSPLGIQVVGEYMCPVTVVAVPKG